MEYYEVIVTSGADTVEMQIFPDGKVKAEEKKPAEKKKEDKE